MSRVLLSMMVTLDGRIAGPGGDLDWFRSDRDFEDEMLGVLRRVDAMLFGRVAYLELARYWPTAGTSDQDAPGGFSSRDVAREFADLMNRIPKVVYSRTLTEATWGPARIVSDDIAGDLAAMTAAATGDLVVFAGGSLASTLVDQDLIDEYRLLVHPTVLGPGTPLFQDISATRHLRLARTRTFPSGVVLLQYDRGRGDGH